MRSITNKIHIIGSGLAGLSTAINAIKKKINCEVYESSKNAGGRCRSFFDKQINLKIDNGNHLVFSANKSFLNFCETIGSMSTFKLISQDLKFFDIKSYDSWELGFKENLLKNIFFKCPIPKTSFFDYLSFLKFLFVKNNTTVDELVGRSKIFTTFWEPFTLAVMNTSPDYATAKVLSNVLKETLFKGKKNCLIYQPIKNWGESLIDPAVRFIKKNKVRINFNETLRKVNTRQGKIEELVFTNKKVKIKDGERVVFAIPPSNIVKLFPEFSLPCDYNTILNIHYKVSFKNQKLFKNEILGFINTISQWVFVKKNCISITVSDANKFNSLDSDTITKEVWKEVCTFLGKNIQYENAKIIKEKKATYIQSPKNNALIQKFNEKKINNIFAGDWTQNTLPCTIEASILSGKKAIESL